MRDEEADARVRQQVQDVRIPRLLQVGEQLRLNVTLNLAGLSVAESVRDWFEDEDTSAGEDANAEPSS